MASSNEDSTPLDSLLQHNKPVIISSEDIESPHVAEVPRGDRETIQQRLLGLVNRARVMLHKDPETREGDPDPPPRKTTGASRAGKCLTQNLLTITTMSSVIAGIVLGITLKARPEPWTKREVMYVTFPGDLFLRMLKALILPLIVSSLIAALGGLDLKLSGRIGVRAVVYYMATTVCAVILGMILVTIIRPGKGEPDEIQRGGTSRNVTTVDTLLDLVRNMFPPNLVEACVFQYRTLLKPPSSDVKDQNTTIVVKLGENASNETQPTKSLYDWEIDWENTPGTNILGLVVFAVVLGITISRMQEKGKPLYNLFASLSEAMMLITGWVIWLSPFGILFLVCGKMLEMSSLSVVVGQLGMYFLTVMVGLFLHGFVVIPLIFLVVTRTLPFRFIGNMVEALLTAFGTASSSASLPITIRCLEEKNGVDRRVARFVLPVGATINMDGTALYEAVAALFIAQVRNVPLDLGKIIGVSITATAASIGAAGIPQAGLVTMVMVLDTVGLPAEDVTLIIVVDWLLDRFRTMINVLGDSIGAGIVNHLSYNDLKQCPDVELAAVEFRERAGSGFSSTGSQTDKARNNGTKCDDHNESHTTSM